MRSRRRLLAALLVLAACQSSSSTVAPPVATSLSLSASDVSFSSLLATLDLTASVLSELGAPISGVTIAWSSLNEQVATVSATGRVTAVGNGATQIIATASGLQEEVNVTVQQVPFSIALTPDPVDLVGPLDTEQIVATVQDAGGSAIVSASPTWTSQNQTVAIVDASGVVTGVATGQTTVTAEVATSGAPLVESTTIRVGGNVLIVTTSLPDAVAGSSYDEAVEAVGGDNTYVFALVSGSLPAGLALDPDGTISGTPTTPGTSSFTVEVTSDGQTDTQDLSIEVLSSVILDTSYLVGGAVGDAYGDQIASAVGGTGSYTYSITGGALPPGLSLASTTGAIAGSPTTPGVHFFEITASSGGEDGSARYAITISTVPANAFNLWISFDGGPLPPANVVTALNGALARWEEVVIGDVGDVIYPPTGLDADDCSLVDPTMLNGAFIDDFVVLMAIAPFDGPGNTLARGGPCGYGRQTLPAAISGQMSLDQADINTSSDFLETVIWHEIGHAVGIGTLWQGSVTGVGTSDPRYNGTSGNAEWRSLGTAFDGVPLQPDVAAHWSEAWFDSEIMTPVSEGQGGPAPISRVTIGTLVDLGWMADYGVADSYSLPGCANACSFMAPSEVVPFDIVVVEPLKPLPK